MTNSGVGEVAYPSISYTPLEITLYLPSGVRLSGFPPNHIRSLLASSFLEAVCTQDGRCESCMLATTCPYPAIFHPRAPSTFLVPQNSEIPPPFVLAAPWTLRRLPPHGSLHFTVTLFTSPGRFLPYLLAGLRRSESGKIHGLRFLLHEVHSGPQPVYRRDEDHIRPPSTFIFSSSMVPSRATGATLIFRSPVFLKNKALPNRPPSFSDILKALARRYSLLLHFHQGKTWSPPENFFSSAEEVHYAFTEYRWHTFSRFSQRQKQSMNLSGFTGTLHIEGPIEPYLFLILAGQYLHLGGKTSFGFGAYFVRLWTKEGNHDTPG